MKISELIQKLQEQKASNGDLEVILPQFHEDAEKGDVEWQAQVHYIEPHLDMKTNQVKLAIF